MRFLLSSLLFLILAVTQRLVAQTPFSVRWSFEGSLSGASSVPEVTPGNPSFVGVNVPSPLAIPPPAGPSGLGINLQHWSTSPTCNNTNEFAEFTINASDKVTLQQFSFFFSKSSSGPTQLSVRSSVDGFNAVVFQQAVTDGYQQAVIPLSGASYTEVTGPITFRISACLPASTGGVLRLDEVAFTGVVAAVLPVRLTYIRAKSTDNAIDLNWETAWEQNTDYFAVERSMDGEVFHKIGTVAAAGTTDQRQTYSFRDSAPALSINYYRLQQVDKDGRTELSKMVAAQIANDVPSLEIMQNPVEGPIIRLRLRNLPAESLTLTTMTGLPVSIETYSEANDVVRLTVKQPLRAGLYVLQAKKGLMQLGRKVMVR
ncbi:hypothetical protein [Tellurirhabdus bombi]|uniref:hypothetical protein n=1 Tax=Tellurirhabdus bombi TaxID=2907205 RepID=UPI001F41E287|nr:hypothetical protein [Tellurirhabdus bombi]